VGGMHGVSLRPGQSLLLGWFAELTSTGARALCLLCWCSPVAVLLSTLELLRFFSKLLLARHPVYKSPSQVFPCRTGDCGIMPQVSCYVNSFLILFCKIIKIHFCSFGLARRDTT
jgi:hypothetical protein